MVKIYFIFPITGVKLDREFINELETTQSRCIIYTQFNFFFFCIFFFPYILWIKSLGSCIYYIHFQRYITTMIML